MHYLRLLIIAIAFICVLALAAVALVNGPDPQEAPADDDIIIKGGSLEIDCGKKHGKDCFGGNSNGKKPKHKKTNGTITKIVVTDLNSAPGTPALLDRSFDRTNKPQIAITYVELPPK